MHTALWVAVFTAVLASRQGPRQAVLPFVARSSDFPIRGNFYGSVTVDSLDAVVTLDSADLSVADADSAQFLGGLAIGLARPAGGDEWEIEHRSAFLRLRRLLDPGETFRIPAFVARVPRSRLKSLDRVWLVIQMALGGLDGLTDEPPLGYGYAHSDRRLFRGSILPKRAAVDGRPEMHTTGSALVPGTCGTLSLGPDKDGARQPGEVTVSFVIDTLGQPEPGSFSARPPSKAADAAIAAVRQCRFQTAAVDGQVVRIEASTIVRFTR